MNIKVPGFGDTSSVEYLNPGLLKDTIEYFHDMVEYFVDRGYKRGKTIRAAPYDWRLAAGKAMSLIKYCVGNLQCFLYIIFCMYVNTCINAMCG